MNSEFCQQPAYWTSSFWKQNMERRNTKTKQSFCHLIFWSNEFSRGKLRSVFNCQDHFGWEMNDILRWLTSCELTSQIYSVTPHSRDEMMVRVQYADVHFKLGRRKVLSLGPKTHFRLHFVVRRQHRSFPVKTKHRAYHKPVVFWTWNSQHTCTGLGTLTRSYFSMLSPIDIEMGTSIWELQKPLLPQCIFFHPPGLE